MDRRPGAAVPACALTTAPCLAGAAPRIVPDEAVLDEAVAVVKRRRLLSAAEPACSSIVHEDSERGVHTGAVREKHDRRCGGDPGVAPVRFRMRIDRARGRVPRDDDPDVAMRPVP